MNLLVYHYLEMRRRFGHGMTQSLHLASIQEESPGVGLVLFMGFWEVNYFIEI